MNASPFDLRPLKINKQSAWKAGSGQVVDALCQMFIRKLFYAFQLDNELLIHNQVCKIFTDDNSLVKHWIRRLSLCAAPTQYQFIQHRSLIDLLQEPTAQVVRYLVRGSNHRSHEIIQFMFIHVHKRPIML